MKTKRGVKELPSLLKGKELFFSDRQIQHAQQRYTDMIYRQKINSQKFVVRLIRK